MSYGRSPVVAGPGLGPGVAGYEPAVLPLHYPAMLTAFAWSEANRDAGELNPFIRIVCVYFALLYMGAFGYKKLTALRNLFSALLLGPQTAL